MNPDEQKARGTAVSVLESKLIKLDSSFSDALDAEEQARRNEDQGIRDTLRTGLNDERTARLQLAEEQRRYVDEADRRIARGMDAFINRLSWQDRLSWIFLGRVVR